MRRSKLSWILCFCLACCLSQSAVAGKKQVAAQTKEPTRAEGAFYPDQMVAAPEAPPPEEKTFDPFLVAGVGGLFTAALAGGLAFVFAGRRLEPNRKRAGAR